MAPIRSTRSRLPTAFSSSANRVRKRPGSPMALPSPTRRSAFNPLNLLFGAYDRRQVHTPQNKRELFTRHVFPVSHAPYEPGPLVGFDIECAAFEFQQVDPKLRVQYHDGLATVLFGQGSRIAEGPVGSAATAQSLAQYQLDLSDMTDIIMAELQAAVRQVDLDAAAARREGNADFNLEQTICRAALYHLAVPINNFCEVSDDNFKDLSRSFLWTGWTWDPAEGRAATEWIGKFRGKTRALCHWKLDLTDADMEALLDSARGEQQGGHALHPGFFMSAAGNDLDCTDDRVTVNGAKACALAWADMHRKNCRWHMICNGRSAIVFYLARPDVLFVSDVIRHDAGERAEALTIALTLLALIILPVDQRPTCSFNNQAMTYHVEAAKK